MNITENWLESIYSDGSPYFVSNPTPKKGEKITISLQVASGSPVTKIFLTGKHNGIERPFEMKKSSCKNGLDRYECPVTIFEDEFSYQFFILTEDKIFYYNQKGLSTVLQSLESNFRIITDLQLPEWVKSTVFYQIFPERFCNGNPENDVKDGEYTFDGFPCQKVKNWQSVPEPYEKAHCLDFYGGDLEGITEKIPYLKKLGVNAIYLNPIFYGATVHKYDCLDYFQVDPHFGGNKALEELCKKLHENGIKIILDVSINHTGTANKWFNKEGVFFDKKEGAYNNPQSEEREYYFFNKDGSYKAWFDVPTLPTLNYTSEKLRQKLYKSKDSLVKKWLSPPYCIDGWRFDVADVMARNDLIQLHHQVWPEIRKSIKETGNDPYILAEDWSDCAEFLNGNEWDSQMNYYGSCRPIRQFYGQKDLFFGKEPSIACVKYKMTALDLAERIESWLSRIPSALRYWQFNLIDSHDVPRLHNDKNISDDMYKGAISMIFTLPGCTNMYYGDEAQIDGRTQDIEGCRYPMPWNSNIEEIDRYKFYQTLCKLKTSSTSLKDGGFKVLWKKDYVFAFARWTEDEAIFTVCSNDDSERIVKLPLFAFGSKIHNATLSANDVFGEQFAGQIQDGFLVLTVPPKKSYVIKL